MPVIKLEIKSKHSFADSRSFGDAGDYEQLDGAVHFAVDPDNAANETITDLELAPRNAKGLVTFSSDFRMLRPVDSQRGNRRILMDIPNRGKPLALGNINSAPDVAPDAPMDPGNGFLMRQGYTVVWCAWQHDVPDVPGMLRISLPDAVTPEGPISEEVPLYICGSPIRREPEMAQRVASNLQRDAGEIISPLVQPDDFPIQDLIVNVGLILREA